MPLPATTATDDAPPAPQPHEQLFVGWITGGATTAVPDGVHDEGHGTHVYEQPLVGWVLLATPGVWR